LLLSIAAFLTPLIGGQLSNDAWELEPGYAPTVRALFRGFEIATLQHAILALFVVAAFVYLVTTRKIVQAPHAWITAPLASFLALLLASVFMSRYRWTSEIECAEWMVYGIGLIATVAGLGRKTGPMAVLSSLAAGCGFVALIGVIEYGNAGDRSWRIFSTWNNPNALAGAMVIGTLIGLGLISFGLPSRERKPLLPGMVALGGCTSILCGMALLLTGSKGGLLSLAAGMAVFAVLVTIWRKPVALLAIAGCTVVFCLPLVAMRSSGGSGAPRVLNASSNQAQSVDFRKHLWQGAISLVKDNPIGSGLGTYADYSAKPGTNTRTELAHSTWLQLAVESGLLAPIVLLLMLLGWFVHTFRSARALPTDQNVLRASVIAAVVAIVADGLIESNLYFFGIGLMAFLLLGVGVQLSADAGAPEFVARPMRAAVSVFSVACLGLLFYGGYVAKLQANLRWYLSKSMTEEARSAQKDIEAFAPFDGETWYRGASLEETLPEAIADMKRAAAIAPSPKYLRRLAALQIMGELPAAAEVSITQALTFDPNNLTTLKQLMDLQEKQEEPMEAKQTAERIIAVEDKPYFQVRALPQIIPTETYEARIYLAKTARDKAPLLKKAVEGLQQFALVTVPYVRDMSKAGAGGVAGISLDEATSKVKIGIGAAHELRQIYLRTGDKLGVAWVDKALSDLEGALGTTK
jgi:O-antigen ligase